MSEFYAVRLAFIELLPRIAIKEISGDGYGTDTNSGRIGHDVIAAAFER